MTPSQAIESLLLLPDWTETRIAEATGTTQPTINRIKKGASPAYQTGAAIVALWAEIFTPTASPSAEKVA